MDKEEAIDEPTEPFTKPVVEETPATDTPPPPIATEASPLVEPGGHKPASKDIVTTTKVNQEQKRKIPKNNQAAQVQETYSKVGASLADEDDAFSFKNNCDKSKRIAVVVHTVRAEYEEFDLEQQESSATALTSPQYTENVLMRKTDKKTQVETIDKNILAANTEDLKIENHDKFKNQVTKTGANHQPV